MAALRPASNNHPNRGLPYKVYGSYDTKPLAAFSVIDEAHVYARDKSKGSSVMYRIRNRRNQLAAYWRGEMMHG